MGCKALVTAISSGPPKYGAADGILWECNRSALLPALVADLERAAAEYAGRSEEPVRVISGARTLRRQAELMAPMTPEQLEALYCRNGYPQYIRDLVAIRGHDGAVTASQAYEVLIQRTEGYVSAHLSGAAVDLAVPQDDAHVAFLKELLARHGFNVLDERSAGIPCIHATHTASPLRIVKE
ncbi:MAG: hypothetical protein A3K19_15900 [Lentisphaerae bacterium RIFOXYB12_FULL_65_16]|nr:MAG: hypothetical protein A3K18_06045 [Lentisphaerae bacterium RIFOXYA12_64_32]OGV87308.1 MAG: hypothetical protein A3K19_15900 [Lentisphaerae bacterium RIFOXYB12_FULL_65_16]